MVALFGAPFIFIMYQKNKIANAKTSREKFYRYDDLFKYYASQNGFPWRWLKAISKQESDLGDDKRVRNNEVSYDGKSYGIMQIAEGLGSEKEKALKGYGGRDKLNDPAYSIDKAAQLVGYLNSKYKGNKDKVFLAYNQGENNTDRGKRYDLDHTPNGYPEQINKWLDWISQKEEEYK